MITAGIDVGIEFTKAVVMNDGKIVGRGIAVSGGVGRNDAAMEAMADAICQAGIAADAVEKTVATGKGKYDVKFADDFYTEVIAISKAAKYICADATMIVNFGADEILAAVLGEAGKVKETVLNQKCSAGLGTFLRTMARRLEMSIEEMAQCDVSGDDIAVQDGCIVFAEMGALSMLNQGKSVGEVASAVTKAAAVRAATVLNDIILQNTSHVLFTGGLAKNGAFMEALHNRYGMNYTIPEYPEYVGAIGAAIIAAE